MLFFALIAFNSALADPEPGGSLPCDYDMKYCNPHSCDYSLAHCCKIPKTHYGDPKNPLCQQGQQQQTVGLFKGNMILALLGGPSDILTRGQYICSPSRKYKAIYQTDGNFCLYRAENNGKTFRWCSHQNENQDTSVLRIQTDGNLVMYKGCSSTVCESPFWASNSVSTQDNYKLTLRDNGNLVIYGQNTGNQVWSTNTADSNSYLYTATFSDCQ